MSSADSVSVSERPALADPDRDQAPPARTPADGGPTEAVVAGSPEGPSPEEIQAPVLENVDRAVTGLITVVPLLLAGGARRLAAVEP
ncbi:MAG TPA: hypothetical protein VFC30_05375 [Solirubrobacteraceae bacterium]|nr:hypothetical protein [Solirubrobacteraceae bacterium]